MVAVPDEGSTGLISLASWLDEAFRAERQALSVFVQHRHELLSASLESRLLQSADLTLENGPFEVASTSESKAKSEPKLGTGKAKVSLREAKADLHPHGDCHPVCGTHGAAHAMDVTPSGPPHKWPRNVPELIHWPFFEIFFTVIIVLNSMITAVEVQYRGTRFGESMGWHGDDAGTYALDPSYEAAMLWMAWIFGIVFTIELILKIIGEGRQFVRSGWNLFDFLVIAVWAFKEIVGVDDLPLDPMALRLVRMMRILKIMRMLRVLNTVEAIGTLKLLTRTIACSGSILFWTVLLFFLVVFLMSLLLNFMLDGFMHDTDIVENEREQVYHYFGTFSGAMLSMFEVTIGNWVPITRLLSGLVSEVYMAIFIFYKLVVGFAIVKIISGVFMHETFKVAANDDELMVMQRSNQMRVHKQKMQELFNEVDDSGDGRLSWPEFQDILNDDRVKTWLSAMELDVSDARLLFELLDDGDGSLTADELVLGVKKLKGAARSIDMVTMMREVKELSHEIKQVEAQCNRCNPPPSAAAIAESVQGSLSGILPSIREQLVEALRDFEVSGVQPSRCYREDSSRSLPLSNAAGALVGHDSRPSPPQEELLSPAEMSIHAGDRDAYQALTAAGQGAITILGRDRSPLSSRLHGGRWAASAGGAAVHPVSEGRSTALPASAAGMQIPRQALRGPAQVATKISRKPSGPKHDFFGVPADANPHIGI